MIPTIIKETDLTRTRDIESNILTITLYLNPFVFNINDGGLNNVLKSQKHVQDGGLNDVLQAKNTIHSDN